MLNAASVWVRMGGPSIRAGLVPGFPILIMAFPSEGVMRHYVNHRFTTRVSLSSERSAADLADNVLSNHGSEIRAVTRPSFHTVLP